jgi:predicted nucleic acid-binding protein
MNPARHNEIMSHVELQFKPQWVELRDQYNRELREAQFQARQTNNSAAILPAECACYVAHAKALVVMRAKCIAEAYTSFNEPASRNAEVELTKFFNHVVSGRKSSFSGEAERRTRAGVAIPSRQLSALLRNFEREARIGLDEGLAILDKQRVTLKNILAATAKSTKYVLDTCVFNWLADGRITKDDLPSGGGFAITTIQLDEINKTKDDERRARLSITQTSLRCELLPTQTFVFDVARSDYAKWGDGKLFNSLKTGLDALNGGKENNTRDALISETAIGNGLTLLTTDEDLKIVTERHGGRVIFYSQPSAVKPAK